MKPISEVVGLVQSMHKVFTKEATLIIHEAMVAVATAEGIERMSFIGNERHFFRAGKRVDCEPCMQLDRCYCVYVHNSGFTDEWSAGSGWNSRMTQEQPRKHRRR